ncbi:hypothetical protein TELCIR_23224 [Teladorsagia circumcincta]|uniref:Chromo domain-containing protein n=1 Tax=Teladorsagia circumcincta TaxID=45464 RepID=A0A2G9TDE4_TELCI|nr:hypothetical protein TELCIR_23224 [Teladorsagia circumcincta]
MSGEKYEIKRILKARKMEGKNKMEYLVDWEPTWVYEQDMDAALLDDYHMTVEVLGPLYTPENLQKTCIKEMDLVIKRQSKREQQSNDEVILDLMPYEQVIQEVLCSSLKLVVMTTSGSSFFSLVLFTQLIKSWSRFLFLH